MLNDLRIQLKPSRWMSLGLLVLLILSLLAVYLLQAAPVVKMILGLALVFGAVISIRRVGLMSADSVLSIQSIRHHKEWLLEYKNGLKFKMQHQQAWVFRYVVILKMISLNNKQPKVLWITADTLSFEQHRRLRSYASLLDQSGDH